MPARGAVAVARARDFFRDLVWTGEDTNTGETMTATIVTDGGPGSYLKEWGSDARYRGGMSLVGCWRAATLKAGILATAPWDVYRTRDGAPEKITPRPSILEQPAPPEARVDTLTGWHLDLMWHGNAVGVYTAYDATGWPTAVVPVPADTVLVERTGPNIPGWPVGAVRYWIGGQWWSADRVMHIKGMHRPGDLRGMGILEAHLQGALKLAGTLQEQATSVANHAVPSVLIENLDPDQTQADADKIKAKYLESQRVRSPMVVNPSIRITPLAWNPDETQLVEARTLSLVEQALMFGVDPTWVGAGQTSGSYANVQDQATNIVKFSMTEHFARFEQVLTLRAVPRGQWVEANLDALLRGDTLTRYQAYEIAITNGFLTRDEVREMERRRKLTAEQRDEAIPPKPEPAAPHDPARPPGGNAQDPATGTPAGAKRKLTAVRAMAEMDDELAAIGVRAAQSEHSLKAYWTTGEGLAKWASHPHPWTALYGHLKRGKGLTDEQAKRIASQWFHDVFGIWPGERKGDNPVGRG